MEFLFVLLIGPGLIILSITCWLMEVVSIISPKPVGDFLSQLMSSGSSASGITWSFLISMIFWIALIFVSIKYLPHLHINISWS